MYIGGLRDEGRGTPSELAIGQIWTVPGASSNGIMMACTIRVHQRLPGSRCMTPKPFSYPRNKAPNICPSFFLQRKCILLTTILTILFATLVAVRSTFEACEARFHGVALCQPSTTTA